MYLNIILFPFLSFISCFFFGRFIGIIGSCVLSTFAIMSSAAIAMFIVYETALCGSSCNFVLVN